MSKQGWLIGICAGALELAIVALHAEPIPVPNASFETQPPGFVNINIDSWQKAPKPAWYDESSGFRWDQLVGAFSNTAPSSVHNHIVNCDGIQATWLFATPEVALFQDYDTQDWNDAAPSHAFDARFEVGKSYHLTVGVIGTGGGMRQGVTLDLSLYYRDAASNRVTVALTTLTNISTVFSNNTRLVDCWVHVPPVRANDPWAGKHIGIQFMSTVSYEQRGGYWDLDNVRLTAGPALLKPTHTAEQFAFTLLGEPGQRFEIQTTTDPALAPSNWTSIGTVTNLTGTIPFIDTAPNFNERFYRAWQLP